MMSISKILSKTFIIVMVLLMVICSLVQTSFAIDVGDTNNDGKVNSLDIVYLARHIAGWSGYEDLPYIGWGMGSEPEYEFPTEGYLAIDNVVDFTLYDHVVVQAYIDGVSHDIKIKTIIEESDTIELDRLNYNNLTSVLDNLFGIYKYTVDDDGYFAVTVVDFEYMVSDFATGNSIKFKDGVIINGKTSGLADGVNKRNVMLRINSATTICLVDSIKGKIIPVKVKATGDFTIELPSDTMFYADKIGYGTNDESIKDDDITWEHGVANVIFINASEDDVYIETEIVASDYKLIFVQEPVTTNVFVAENGLELFSVENEENEDEELETETFYAKYTFHANAYMLSTLAEVDVAYMENDASGDLEAGVYLLDNNDIIIGSISLSNIKIDNVNTILIPGTTSAFGFIAVNIPKTNIDLYNWGDIRIWSTAKTSGVPMLGSYNGNNITVLPFAPDFNNSKNVLDSNIQTLRFMEITVEQDNGQTVYATNTYEAKKDEVKSTLMTYIDAQEDDTVTVIMAGNCPIGKTSSNNMIVWMSGYASVPNSALIGIIIDNLLQ